MDSLDLIKGVKSTIVILFIAIVLNFVYTIMLLTEIKELDAYITKSIRLDSTRLK